MRESVAKGNCRDGNLWDHLRAGLEIGFWDYAPFGIPITILTTIAGIFLLLLFH